MKTLIHNIGQLLTLNPAADGLGESIGMAVLIQDERIVWIGETQEVDSGRADVVIDARGGLVTPGLIDSHTHAIFAGNRANEFEMRLQGKSYLEIAASGGGILKTVEATRQASAEELYALTRKRLLRMLSYGVTTVEVKSGYGLDFETERKCLRVLRQLQSDLPMTIVPTYMGAHDIPPEFKGRTDDYVDLLCQEYIPAVAAEGLAVFCDVFCEQGYFDVAQSRRILEAARQHGLHLKVHAEEFCELGGAELAGELRATSADHLLHIGEKGIAALRAGGAVATLLPGTAFYLRLEQYAPASALIAAGVPVALATDFNPGSCAIDNLQLIMSLACLQMNMTLSDVLKGVTRHAAKAVGLEADRGYLAVGSRADLVLWDALDYQELLYYVGRNPVRGVVVSGTYFSREQLEAQSLSETTP
ncbi:MAG TPA: imidazolonepropionase [Oculatellaceae cyanobacterium]